MTFLFVYLLLTSTRVDTHDSFLSRRKVDRRTNGEIRWTRYVIVILSSVYYYYVFSVNAITLLFYSESSNVSSNSISYIWYIHIIGISRIYVPVT